MASATVFQASREIWGETCCRVVIRNFETSSGVQLTIVAMSRDVSKEEELSVRIAFLSRT